MPRLQLPLDIDSTRFNSQFDRAMIIRRLTTETDMLVFPTVVEWSADSRLVVLESGLKSIFAGLGRGLGKICNQVHFHFSLCTFAVFCLGRMTFANPYHTHNQRYPLLT